MVLSGPIASTSCLASETLMDCDGLDWGKTHGPAEASTARTRARRRYRVIKVLRGGRLESRTRVVYSTIRKKHKEGRREVNGGRYRYQRAHCRERPFGTRGKVQGGHAQAPHALPRPAFIASVAYIDPGNYATNIQAGAEFGYALLWVIFASNLIAMLVQAMAAKLGIATGMNLAQHCRASYPEWANWALWVMMEIVAMATDLAEFLGAAWAYSSSSACPLWAGGLFTAVATFLILGLERYGFRPLEAVITAFVAIVALSYLLEIFIAGPTGRPSVSALARPRSRARRGPPRRRAYSALP
jgi:hypothetical protein